MTAVRDYPLFWLFLWEMKLTECPGGVAPAMGSPGREQNSGGTSSVPSTCRVKTSLLQFSLSLLLAVFFTYRKLWWLLSHLPPFPGHWQDAAGCPLGMSLTGSSWSWRCEFLLQSSSSMETETGFPLFIQKWVIPHAAYKEHLCFWCF